MSEFICREVQAADRFYLKAESKLVRCKDCKHWRTDDGMFPDFDGMQWHKCGMLETFKDKGGYSPACKAYSYCFAGERKE